jgi:hypothetical protein
VTEVRSGTRKPCQFPFVLLNQTFNECTDILGVDPKTGKITTVNELWCSTNVDPQTKKHIEGGSYYGDCPSSCQAPRTGDYLFKDFIEIYFFSLTTFQCISDTNSGCWKPDPKKNQCGTWLKPSTSSRVRNI